MIAMLRCTWCNRLRNDDQPMCACGRETSSYEPTANELRCACYQIQDGWSKAEEKRRHVQPVDPVGVTRECRVGDGLRRKSAKG